MSKLLSSLAVATVAIASTVATAQVHAADLDWYKARPSAVTHESATVFGDQPSTLSRAEVQADLQVWKESGLAELQNGYTTAVLSPQYQRALARYTALRKSPRFDMLVLFNAAKRGEAVAGETPDAALAVQ
jgi:hypothetical protein